MENGVLPPPRFTLHRKDPHADKERAVSSFRQPRRRPVFLPERIILLNRPLQLFPLFRMFFCACALQKADPPWSRAWLFVTWISCLLRSPSLTSPAAAFQSLQKKKKKWLDLCFPGVSVPHLTYQSLSRQEAAELLWAKPLANEESSPAAACGFCMCFFGLQPPRPPTCTQPPP